MAQDVVREFFHCHHYFQWLSMDIVAKPIEKTRSGRLGRIVYFKGIVDPRGITGTGNGELRNSEQEELQIKCVLYKEEAVGLWCPEYVEIRSKYTEELFHYDFENKWTHSETDPRNWWYISTFELSR